MYPEMSKARGWVLNLLPKNINLAKSLRKARKILFFQPSFDEIEALDGASVTLAPSWV